MMKMLAQNTASRVWLQWTLATVVGAVIGCGLVVMLFPLILNSDWGMASSLLGLVILGGCIGSFQTLVLRRTFSDLKGWLIASVLGWVLVSVTALIMAVLLMGVFSGEGTSGDDAEIAGAAVGWGVGLLLIGGEVGLVQLVALRVQLIRWRGWLWGSVLGWGLGVAAFLGVLWLSAAHPLWIVLGGGGLAGLFVGVITGWVLRQQLRGWQVRY